MTFGIDPRRPGPLTRAAATVGGAMLLIVIAAGLVLMALACLWSLERQPQERPAQRVRFEAQP